MSPASLRQQHPRGKATAPGTADPSGGRHVTAAPPAGSRIIGVDIARGLAIIGMFVAHAIPRPDNTELLVDGRSSILFATLAGVSLGLMTGGARPLAPGSRADAVRATLIRALALLLLGAALSLTGSEIAIILDYYAVMFVLIVPVLWAPRWLLAGLATFLTIGAPLIAAQLPPFEGNAFDAQDVVSAYFFTGYYPALVWLPFLCVGLMCARSDISRRSTQYWMMSLGSAASAIGYGVAAVLPGVDATAHSGSTAEIVGSGGFAIALLGGMVWIGSRGGTVGHLIRRIAWPVAAAGTMALSVYVTQILLLATAAYLRDTSGGIDYPGFPLLVAMTVLSLLAATLWRRYLGQGPLERLLAAITRRRRRS